MERGFLSRLSVLHGVHALHVAEAAGYVPASGRASSFGPVVQAIWERERDWLAQAEGPLEGWAYATAAYALHLGVKLGALQVDQAARDWILGLPPADLPVEVLGWLLGPASRDRALRQLREALLQELANRALTNGATVTFRQGGRKVALSPDLDVERLLLASTRRSDAAVLAALLEEEPDHPLIPGLVRGLLGQRDGDRRAGAHENGWVLLALGRYAAVHEREAADLTVTPALGGRPLSEPIRLGPTLPTVSLTGALPPPGERTTLEVEVGGSGSLHLRAAVRYSPVVTLETPPAERGFLISRRYEAVDDSADVVRDPDGTWLIRAGARVRVRLVFSALARRYQVQLRDPLPGGLEAVNPRLRGTGFTDDPRPPPGVDAPSGMVSPFLGATSWSGPFGWDLTSATFAWRASWGGWATHEELRDDRMEAYTPFLLAGTYESTYLVRATTPGTYLAAPARVEETEHPERFGHTRPDRVVVEVRR